MNSLLHCSFIFLLFSTFQNSIAIPIYQSIGKHGELLYGQFPPQGQHTVLNFYSPKPSNKPEPTTSEKQKQCQTLRSNLNALNTGDAVYEIDAQGNQKQLTADEITLRKSQTQTALKEHC